MLPYSPLHHLLLDDSRAVLVMTSANVSDEPIAYRDEDALERLAGIADLFLMHDRPIETRTDDSVLRVVVDRPLFLRRSRGYVPRDLSLGTPRPILACGAELKNTFCVAKGGRAWVGHHIGDLQNYETLRSFTEGIEHFESLFAVRPELVAHDLHPEYLSTKYARGGVETISAAPSRPSRSVPGGAGESGRRRRHLRRTGYGTDGTVWGGLLMATHGQRAGPAPGPHAGRGERAIPLAWRTANAWLLETAGGGPPLPPLLTGRSPRMPGARLPSWRRAPHHR
jgi:hydrogenase maturation protein HypF